MFKILFWCPFLFVYWNKIFWYWSILAYRYEITGILFYLYTYISLNIISESPYNLLKILKLLVYISTYQSVRF